MVDANRCLGHWLNIQKKKEIITIKGNFFNIYKLITQFQCINYYIISFLVCLTTTRRHQLAFP